MCMCVPSASIPHFVPIIRGMGPNAAIHTSVGAAEAATVENGGLLQESGRKWEEHQAKDARPKDRMENNMIRCNK